jgi:hypothetical protein
MRKLLIPTLSHEIAHERGLWRRDFPIGMGRSDLP